MKNILLATTALVMSAGFASAEVTLSGTAHAGMKNSTGAASTVYSGMTVKFAAATTTDNGLTMSISESIGGGQTLDLLDDFALDTGNTAMGVPTMTISGGGVTVTMEHDSIGNKYDGDGDDGDIGVSGKFGDLSWGITAETHSEVPTTAEGLDVSNSYSLGYTMGAIGLTLVGTDADQSKATASYTMGDTVFSAYSKNTGTATVIGGGVDLTLNGATVSYTGNDADEWDLSVGYVLDAVSIAYSTSEAKDWTATAVYALGGSAQVNLGTNNANTTFAGVSFAF
jgi:outer membrane protein OmpU